MRFVVFTILGIVLFLFAVIAYHVLSEYWEGGRRRRERRRKKGFNSPLGDTTTADQASPPVLDWTLIYEEANQSRRFEGNLVWTRFSGMLVAHTILSTLVAAALGLVDISAGEDPDLPWMLTLIVIISGFLLCFVWWHLTRVGIMYMDEWGNVVDHIETTYLAESSAYPLLRIMHRRPRCGFGHVHHPRPHYAQYVTILVFAMVYSGSLAWLIIET